MYSIELLGAAKVYSREYSEAFFLFTSTLFHLFPFPQPPSWKRQIIERNDSREELVKRLFFYVPAFGSS